MSSPTQRTLAECKARGWIPAVVERWNPHARIRQDLFGFLDLVVLDGKPGILGLQATGGSGGNARARARKIEESPLAVEWLKRGLRVQVWSWRKLAAHKKDGSRAKRDRWAARVLTASLEGEGIAWAEEELSASKENA